MHARKFLYFVFLGVFIIGIASGSVMRAASPTISVAETSVAAGSTITITFSDSGRIADPGDKIGFLASSASSQTVSGQVAGWWGGGLYSGSGSITTSSSGVGANWIYTSSCTQTTASARSSGTCTWTIPATLPAGDYAAYLFANGSSTQRAKSNVFKITTSIKISPVSLAQGDTLAMAFNNIASAKTNDHIGIFADGDTVDASHEKKLLYTSSCTTTKSSTAKVSGSCDWIIPASIGAGNYIARLFHSGSYTELAHSEKFAVASAPDETIAITPASISLGNPITINFSHILDPKTNDRIGIYLKTTESSKTNESSNWIYTSSCSQTKGSTAKSSNTCTWTVPITLAAGTYQARLFAATTYTDAYAVADFTIIDAQAATITLTPSSVLPGGTIKIDFGSVVKPAPKKDDLIGIFKQSDQSTETARGNNYFYASSCTTTKGTSAKSSGSCEWKVPTALAAGSYEVRFFAGTDYSSLRAKGALTVKPPSLAATPATVSPGGTITFNFSDVVAPDVKDRIAIYLSSVTTFNSANEGTNWIYTSSCSQTAGTAAKSSNACTWTVPASLAANNNYTAYLFAAQKYDKFLAQSGVFSIPTQSCTASQVSGCRVCKADGSGWVDDNAKCTVSGQTCQNGACICTSHTSIKCSGDNLYYYNSCGGQEELINDCTDDSSTGNYQCNGSWLQREYIDGTCENSSCVRNRIWKNDQNCSDNGRVCRSDACVTQCQTRTCSSAGYQCGNIDDGCGGTINCGGCANGYTCSGGRCIVGETLASTKTQLRAKILQIQQIILLLTQKLQAILAKKSLSVLVSAADPDQFVKSVTAYPDQIVNFKIEVTNNSDNTVSNIRLRNKLPAYMTNLANLQVDGAASSGDITNELNIGSVGAGQTVTITFSANIVQVSGIPYNGFAFSDIAVAYNDEIWANDKMTITVRQ